MERPVIPVVIALMAGIACGHLFSVPDTFVQIVLLIALLITLLTFRGMRLCLFYPSLLLSLFLVGILDMNLAFYRSPENNHIVDFAGDEKHNIEGMVCENPQVFPDKTELIVSTTRLLRNEGYQPVSGLVLLNVKTPINCRYGDVIRFKSRLRAPHNFNNPGAFDYERYLRYRGILVRGFVGDPSGIVILRRDRGNPLRQDLEHFRDRIRMTITQKAPGLNGRIIQAMILGNQKEIPKEIMEKFNRTGTTHIIAISGFNVGIVAVFSLFLIRLCFKSSVYLLLRWDMTKAATFFAILTVVLYMFVAGMGISVIRATIMVSLFMVAIVFNRERDFYNTLALAALVILIISPISLFDISFQLSFAAVAAILFLTPRLVGLLPPPDPRPPTEGTGRPFISILKKAGRGISVFCFVSLSATLGTLPLILLYFNRLSVVGLAANLIVVPILGVVATPIFLLLILTIPLSDLLTDGIMALSSLLVAISLDLVDRLAAPSWSSLYVPTPNLFEILAFYLFLISAGLCLERWQRPKTAIAARKTFPRISMGMAAIAVLFLILEPIYLHYRDSKEQMLKLTAVDVGQGSATLIQYPNGLKMLVDGGGFHDDAFDIGKYVLAPYLWRKRITRIDTAVLTHPHPDHLQGLLFILENFHVKEVWTNGQSINTPLYLSFLEIIGRRGITLKTLSDATPKLTIAGVHLRIFNPVHPGGSTDLLEHQNPPRTKAGKTASAGANPGLPAEQDKGRLPRSDFINDQSLVLKLTYDSRSFLLPGDISGTTENRLVHAGYHLKSDLLFVPHHGSVYSSSPSFIDQVAPHIAVISCGYLNVFGNPHRDVIKRYVSRNTMILRTDRDGAVTLKTDGKELHTSTFRSVHPNSFLR